MTRSLFLLYMYLLVCVAEATTDSTPSETASTGATTSPLAISGTGHTSETTTNATTTPLVSTDQTGAGYSLDNETDTYMNDTATNETTTTESQKTFREFPEYVYGLYISRYYNYFTNIPGILGNLLTIVTGVRMRPYTATSICIIVLAVTDFSICTTRCVYFYVPGYNLEWCRSKNFFLAFFSIYSNFILVIWTIERLIAVAFPMKLQIWCTVKNTKIALSVACLLSFFLSMVYLIDVTSETLILSQNDTISRCRYGEFIVNVYGYIDFTVYVLIPMALIVICNGLIVSIMSRRKKAHAHMTNNVDSQDKRNAEQKRMTYILLSVTLAFLIFHIPYLVKTSVEIYFFLRPMAFGPHFYAKYWLLGWITISWLELQNTVNFVVYCLSGPRFRNEFFKMVCFFRSESVKTKHVTRNEIRTGGAGATRVTGVSTITSKTA